MLDDKKHAIKKMMGMLDEEVGKKIKVIVEGDTPKEVEKGLDAAKEKMKELPEMGKEVESKDDDRLEDMIENMSPEKKKALLKKLES